jgi:hypothetical protein
LLKSSASDLQSYFGASKTRGNVALHLRRLRDGWAA